MLHFPKSIRDGLQNFRTMLNSLTPTPDSFQKGTFQRDLEAIRKAMENETLKIAEGFHLYGETVNEYYLKFPPFGTNHVDKDFEDFIELIGHSVIVGNYFLISEWGVKHPLSNPSILAGSQFLQRYVDRFKEAITTNWQANQTKYGWPDEAKDYWQYLIREWESDLARR